MNKSLFFFLLVQLKFFGLNSIPSMLFKALSIFWILFLILFGRKIEIKKNYTSTILSVFFMLMINMIVCYSSSGQTPLHYISGTEFINIFSLLSYFAILSLEKDFVKIENTVLSLSLLFIVVYLIQYLILPYGINIFTKNDYETLVYENARFRLPGQGLVVLGLLLSFNRYLNDNKIKWFLNIGLSILVLLILNYRSQIAVIIPIMIIMLVYHKGFSVKRIFRIIIPTMFLFVITLQIPFVGAKIQQMSERQETNTFNNDDYIRFKTLDYYLKELPSTSAERFFGVGLPNERLSPYGKKILKTKQSGLIWADWGLIGLAIMAGIPTVLFMLTYSYKVIRRSLPKQYSYINFWFVFLVFGSIFTREFFRDGAFALQATLLLLSDLIINNQNENRDSNISLHE